MAEETGQALIWDATVRAPDGTLGAWTNSTALGYSPAVSWIDLGISNPSTVAEALDAIHALLTNLDAEIKLPRWFPQ